MNTDGWFPTRNAFRSLFATITPIRCFLHGFLKIRERGRQVRPLHDRVWDVYRAATAGEFRQRMATFRAWCQGQNWPKSVLEMAAKLWNREAEYAEAYSHPGCHRTSNMVDRLMNRVLPASVQNLDGGAAGGGNGRLRSRRTDRVSRRRRGTW